MDERQLNTLIVRLAEMLQGVRQYIGARYVPNFKDDPWNDTTQYEALDVVDNGMGTSYIAKKPVPAGTPLSDREYWFIYGSTSGAIINLQNQIDAIVNTTIPSINSEIEALTNELNGFKFINVVNEGLDPTNTNDNTSALQSIIDAAPVLSILYFPRGNYRFDSKVVINKPLSIMGDGRTQSVFISHINNNAVIEFDTTNNRMDGITVRDIGFAWHNGGVANTRSIAIKVTGDSTGHLTYFNAALFKNIWSAGLETFFYCDKITGTEEIGFNFNTFDSIYTTNEGAQPTEYGFFFETGSGTGLIITNSDIGAGTHGIHFETRSSGVATNIGDILINTIHFSGDSVDTYGIAINGVNARYHNQIVITNCQFDAGVINAFSINTMNTITIHDCNLSDQWNYDLVNCQGVSIDFGVNSKSNFFLSDKTTNRASVNFGSIVSPNNKPLHLKVYAYGDVSGIGTRCAYKEILYNRPSGIKTLTESALDANFNIILTPVDSDAGFYVPVVVDFNGNNNVYPIYVHVEVDCAEITSTLKSNS